MMTDEKKSLIVDIQQDENGELFLQFPDDLMDQLGWQEGDVINWEIDESSGCVIVRKALPTGPIGP